jgi:Zn-finger nucleic acid-binding protein
MKCPIDNTDLVMTDRQGVEIDYCPTCRGVWLDRGELDKIIDRSASSGPARPDNREASVSSSRDSRELTSTGTVPKGNTTYRGDDDDDYRADGRKKKKRGSFLEDLFDF